MSLLRIFLSICLLALTPGLLPSAKANITTQTARVGPYTASPLPATLSVTFPFQQSSDLLVLDMGSAGTSAPVVLTLNSDYTVTGGGYNATNNMQTGSVIVVTGGANNVQAGDMIVILRNVPVNQLTYFPAGGLLTGKMIETALDKQATISQQLTEAVSRTLRFPAGETADGTLVRSARASKYLGFDSTGALAYLDGGSGGGGTTYTAGTGLLLASNEFSVNPTQSLTDLAVTNTITGSVSGNAATATALANPRTINGVSFDGTASITVTAAANTLTGSTLAAGVTASSLTSAAVGTFGTMAIQNATAVTITGGSITGAVVTGLANGSAPSDAVNYSQLLAVSAGITPRSGVVVATTANITLSAPQTIDGTAVVAGNRVLVKNQTAPAENGIYDVAAGAWSRSSDSNTAGELLFGYYYFVSSGTTQAATSWFIQTAPTILGVDPVTFAQFSASQNYSAGSGLTLTGNQFSLNPNLAGITLVNGAYNGTVGAITPNTVVATTVKSTALTATRIPFIGTGGLLQDNAYFTFSNDPDYPQVYLGNGTSTQDYAGGYLLIRAGANKTPGDTMRGVTLNVSNGELAAPDNVFSISRANASDAYLGLMAAYRDSIGWQFFTAANRTATTTTERFRIGAGGALRALAYGAGALSTDASGVIASGVLSGANGGSGVANTGKTITLGGNLTTSGAFNSTFTMTATTGVTFPTSGTLVGSADTGTVTNTMLAGSIANGKLSNSAITIAGTSTSLGDSISLDAITGLSSTGIVKRTGANTLAIATPGSDYLVTAVTSLAGTANEVSASAATGAVTLSLPSTLTFTGKTVTGGTFNSTFNGTLGGTTPAAATVTTLASSSNANTRTTKGNFHVTVNVKDYGAVGDGATNDTTAINSAIAALTSYSALYFPSGNYLVTLGSITALDSVNYVTIYGEGARLYSSTTGASGNGLVVNSTCSHIDIRDLAIVGSATVRGNGVGVRLYSSYSSITNCYISGVSDFAIHVSNDSSSYNLGTRIENNVIVAPLGDGVHIGAAQDFVVAGNTIRDTGDDGIGIIADDASFIPSRGVVSGNAIYNGGSDGIRSTEADDMLIDGNSIHTVVQAGIEVNRYLSTTAYNDRVYVKGNKLYNCVTTGGPRGAIWMNFCNECSVTENEIYDVANGAGICFLDFNDLTIRGNTVRGSPVRAIASDDSTTSNVAATWSGLVIDANVLQYVVANEAIYVVPASGKAVTNLLVTSNVGNQLPSGNWIYYDRVTTGKVGNNTSRDGKAVAAGGTVSGVTAFNNN